jgi:hypothetical protein
MPSLTVRNQHRTMRGAFVVATVVSDNLRVTSLSIDIKPATYAAIVVVGDGTGNSLYIRRRGLNAYVK